MIRRLFWFGLGIASGAWVVLRAKRMLRAWTPRGIADQVAGLGTTFRGFADDVRVAMNAREAELRNALGLNDTIDKQKDGH